MFKYILVTLCLAAFLVGCGSGSSTTKDGDARNVIAGELDYNPTSRWPDRGDYSYNFDTTTNGSRCVAKKQFDNKASYCMGLQDEALNDGCARSSRERVYGSDCGNDFQPMNFTNPFWRSGFDSRLQKSCETGRPRTATFKIMKQYCAFLKDEDLHENCFWDDRQEQFKRQKCQGSFSDEPAVAVPPIAPDPTPTPGTTPGPTPVQPKDPLDSISVVRSLRANGIEVEIDWNAIRNYGGYPLPGELSERERFIVLWEELTNNLQTILAHKKVINKIRISIYTDYRMDTDNEWTLDYQTNRGDLALYFPLFDKIINYSATLNIHFDFIHNTVRKSGNPFEPLVRMISAIEANWESLVGAFGLLKEVDVDSYTRYFSTAGRLTLDRNKIETELPRMLALLRPMGPVYNWAANAGVEIDVDYDIEKEATEVLKAFAILQKSLSDLDVLTKAHRLDKLTIYISDSASLDSNYFESSKDLSLAISPRNPVPVTKSIQSLAKMFRFQMQLQIPVKMFTSDLDDDFDNSILLFEKVLEKVKAKLLRIKKIEVGYETEYYSASRLLNIGAKSSLAKTEAIIDEIK